MQIYALFGDAAGWRSWCTTRAWWQS